MEIPPGGSLGWAGGFCVPIDCECKIFFRLPQIVLSVSTASGYPPLNLHSCKEKVPFIGPCHLPKIWCKKTNVPTKVNLASHQKSCEIPEINFDKNRGIEKAVHKTTDTDTNFQIYQFAIILLILLPHTHTLCLISHNSFSHPMTFFTP